MDEHPLAVGNVARFVALLADMDRLYGVAMQERGVGRLLSVDLTAAAAASAPRGPTT